MSFYKSFHIPLSNSNISLKDALAKMHETSNDASEIPFIVRLVENPDMDFPGIDMFNGAVNLYTHDCIHLILGRGMLPKDEAFVIGFTMGSTNKVMKLEKFLYHFVTEHLYPKVFKFYKDEHIIFDIASNLGHISKCKPLNEVDFKSMENMSLEDIRNHIGIEKDFLINAYILEKTMFSDYIESSRLLN